MPTQGKWTLQHDKARELFPRKPVAVKLRLLYDEFTRPSLCLFYRTGSARGPQILTEKLGQGSTVTVGKYERTHR
jgi:hypothetical protein